MCSRSSSSQDWAHPHSHGENSASMRLKATRQGSSPLRRGKRIPTQAQRAGHGFIPAHAGKTPPDPLAGHRRRDHPRSRGENRSAATPIRSLVGSSPLTRGKPPGLAGSAAAPGAHPRSRGENAFALDRVGAQVGSSPLTRGKRRRQPQDAGDRRLIPTHAGKTTARALSRLRSRAHPRSRGENAPGIASASWFQGSSPLTRGNPTLYSSADIAPGSPPLTEGKLLGGDRDCGQLRLTPAHAGKTLVRMRLTSRCQAHPRSREENIMKQTADAHGAGSSPLTQGKPGDRSADRLPGGLIPTHARKTSPTAT